MTFDAYLHNPALLKGQPKRSISDYVEEHGILVPRRFDSFSDATRSGLPILARSEHPQDYAGASGLLETVRLPFRDVTSYDELKDRVLKDQERAGDLPQQYCDFLGLDLNEFKEQVSFSFWERIEGYNRCVIADSAIQGRYHITTNWSVPDIRFVKNYTIIENGNELRSTGNPLTGDLHNGLGELIELYDRVRSLERFDRNHCPIMEIKTSNGRNYFLQYHRTRNFKQAEFSIDRPYTDNEIAVPFVRGATSLDGIRCKATVTHTFWLCGKDSPLPEMEDASFDSNWNVAYSELMLPKRKLQIISDNSVDHAFLEIVVGHAPRSKLFKSELSVILPPRALMTGEEYKHLKQKTLETKQDQKIDIELLSDGKKAYIRRC